MNETFAYDALRERAKLEDLSGQAWEAFDLLGTSDFERVMRGLTTAESFLRLYQPDNGLIDILRRDAEGLKEILIRTIARSHPDHPNVIRPEQYQACRRFLSHFSSMFTVNYDLLLYWTVMQTELEPPVERDDGFRKPEGDEEATYVTWEPDAHSQNIHYLHGALHVFDSGTEIQKFTWANTGIRLIDQVREAMDRGLFPVFVSEGDSRSKVEKIMHNGFLHRAHRSLISVSKADLSPGNRAS